MHKGNLSKGDARQSKQPMPADESGDELLSYGSPRTSFSVNRSGILSKDVTQDDAAIAAEKSTTSAEQLLEFYRDRCAQFQNERQLLLDRLAQVEVRILDPVDLLL